jgi:hypothetical protein
VAPQEVAGSADASAFAANAGTSAN